VPGLTHCPSPCSCLGLREALPPEVGVLAQGARGRSLHLDVAERVSLGTGPEHLAGGRCLFVGDLKYKRIKSVDYPNADIYQASAYAVATGLDQALLIYAAGEDEPASHDIVRIRRRINVATLDLNVRPNELIRQVERIAARIRHEVAALAA
jgi:5-methylcytosine-specific restriction enzyme subunit McrC